MENKEYTPGQNRPGRRGGMRGPGMGRGPAEKASDFKGTWSNLISYCKSYLPVVIIALICAAGGTVLTLLGPDKHFMCAVLCCHLVSSGLWQQ